MNPKLPTAIFPLPNEECLTVEEENKGDIKKEENIKDIERFRRVLGLWIELPKRRAATQPFLRFQLCWVSNHPLPQLILPITFLCIPVTYNQKSLWNTHSVRMILMMLEEFTQELNYEILIFSV